jgi:hypothetical protein
MKKPEPGLTFNKGVLPHCCGVKLEPDFPSSVCDVCGSRYSSDDIVGVMLSGGGTVRQTLNRGQA